MKTIFSFLFFFGIIVSYAQVTVTFLNPSPTAPSNCLDTWSENGVSMQMVPIPPQSSCSFGYSGGQLDMYPARLVADLSSFTQIDSIQVTFQDVCGIGCTRLYFVSGGMIVDSTSNDSVGVVESYTFVNGASLLMDEFQIQSFEGIVLDFTIYEGVASCAPIKQVEVEDGDIFVEESCHGVILKSDGGFCYRIRVDDNGGLITESVTCP